MDHNELQYIESALKKRWPGIKEEVHCEWWTDHSSEFNSYQERVYRSLEGKLIYYRIWLFPVMKKENNYLFKNEENQQWDFDEELFCMDEAEESFSIVEIKGNLFELAPSPVSLAHCVGKDFKMGAGIAVEFKKRFGNVNKLLSQKKKVGECAFLEENNRFVFYLITKEVSFFQKPTLQALKDSLQSLKRIVIEKGIKILAMPKIGCGLDGLDWVVVKILIVATFQDVPIQIKIINF